MRVCIVQCSTLAIRNIFSAPDRTLALAMHISNCRQEITLAHAPLSLLTVTRGTLAAYHDHMETEVDFGSWTLVETVAWAKKAFGDDVSASFEGLRKCYDVHAHVMHMYICMHVHSYNRTYIALYLYNYTHTAIFHFTCTYELIRLCISFCT